MKLWETTTTTSNLSTSVSWTWNFPDEDPGTAGVREPRSPQPPAPTSAVALEIA